jgi:hypothetical protein
MVRACPNCGAPLPEVPPGAVEHCTFCGVVEREAPKPAPPPPKPEPDIIVVAPKGMGAIVLAVAVGAVALVGLLAVELTRKPAPTLVPPMLPVPSGKLPTAKIPPVPRATSGTGSGSVSVSALSTLEVSGASRPLDGAPLTPPFETFDVAASVDWATAIGVAWHPDAALHRISVSRAAKDGTVNLGRGAYGYVLSYQLESPGAKQDLWLDVRAGTPPDVSVRILQLSSPELPTAKPICALTKAFAALSKAGMASDSPSYGAILTANGHPEWVVSFFKSGSVPRGGEGVVNAATCAVESVK